MDFDDHHYHHRRGRGNQAVFVNPSNADIHLNRWGSSWDWMIFTVMVASLFLVLVIGAIRRHTALHALYAAVLATSALAYFSMASNLGATPVPVEFRGGPGVVTRQIFFARHVEWIITTPLLVLSLLLLTTFTLSHIFTACFAMVLATTAALLASLTPSKYKFGYFVLGIAALVYVLVIFVRGIRRAVSGYTASYTFGIAWLTGLFLLYPICWGVSEGGNVIGVNAEMVFYGILDLLAKPVFCLIMLALLHSRDYSALGLESGKRTEPESRLPTTATDAGAETKQTEAPSQATRPA